MGCVSQHINLELKKKPLLQFLTISIDLLNWLWLLWLIRYWYRYWYCYSLRFRFWFWFWFSGAALVTFQRKKNLISMLLLQSRECPLCTLNTRNSLPYIFVFFVEIAHVYRPILIKTLRLCLTPGHWQKRLNVGWHASI